MKHSALVMVLAAMGCAGGGLPAGPVGGITVPSGNQCIWHFTWNGGDDLDTSDSDQRPGVSSCDAMHFHLDDGLLTIESSADGIMSGLIHSTMCSTMSGTPIPGDATSWFADVRGCGVEGFLGVNLR